MKHKHILLILPVLLMCMQACKNNSVSPKAKITIVGKWFLAKHNLKLLRNGVQVGETIRTDYSKDDFDRFFEDGTGYQSAKGTNASASLSTFHYTLNGKVITLYINANPAVVETITKLTDTEFAVHYESEIADPSNSKQLATEIDDYEFKK
jgi:hypothetical protein